MYNWCHKTFAVDEYCMCFVHVCTCMCVASEIGCYSIVPTAESMDELTFKAGDLIMLKSRIGSDWLKGKTLSGSEGIFPKSYVEIVVSLNTG